MTWHEPSMSGYQSSSWDYSGGMDELEGQSRYITNSLQDSYFGHIISERQRRGQDWQAVLTSWGGNRGLGKTTAAIALAAQVDENEWSSEKGFMNVYEYMDYYLNDTSEGDVLVQDETEIAADSRRAMGKSNVELSQVIAAARFKRVASIYTLPTRSMIDDRIFGLCTFWIHVTERGTAGVYYILQNDFTGEISTYPLRGPHGNQEFIYFPDLSDTQEKRSFDEKKDRFVRRYIRGDLVDDESDEVPKETLKDVERNIRDNLIYSFSGDDISQSEIAERVEETLELGDPEHITPSCSQQQVSKVLSS